MTCQRRSQETRVSKGGFVYKAPGEKMHSKACHFNCTEGSCNPGTRGIASFSKVRGMDVVCMLTIKTMNTMTEGNKRYNIKDIKSFPFK